MGIGQRIRELREERELTVRALSDRTGLAENSISRIERGERMPGATSVEAIARGLGVPPGELFEEPVAPLGEGSELEPGDLYASKKVLGPPPKTYDELLMHAGVYGSGLERPHGRDSGNISELFEGLSYTEAYERYQDLAAKRKTVSRTKDSLLSREDLAPAAKKKIENLDALAYPRMLVAFGTVGEILKEAKAATKVPEEVEEIEEFQNRLPLVGMPGQ